MAKKPIKVKVRILSELPEVYPMYQPEVGGVYEADYIKARCYAKSHSYSPVCAIKILDKYICLRKGEYEILEGV